MNFRLVAILGLTLTCAASAAQFDAAPSALKLPEGQGLLWEDPRELHKVVVNFDGSAPDPATVRLEYWGSRWPQQHLPKDREPGGGDVGWMELGNWYNYGWRKADAQATATGSALSYTFRPVNEKEFPKLTGYSAPFRYTLKIRLVSDSPLPKVTRFEALTDSEVQPHAVYIAWKDKPISNLEVSAFNGKVRSCNTRELRTEIQLDQTINSDPNTFDRTLVIVNHGTKIFTFAVDDLKNGPMFLPHIGAAVLDANDSRSFAAVAEETSKSKGQSLYDRVAAMPEQTWRSAWNSMPPKKSRIYFPAGPDGGRQRFLLDADGNIRFRHNDHYLQGRPGADTPRLAAEPAPVQFRLGEFGQPKDRFLDEDSIPICTSIWDKDGVRVERTAFVTELTGTKSASATPPADALTVLLARYTFTNTTSKPQAVTLPLAYRAGDQAKSLASGENGILVAGVQNSRAQLLVNGKAWSYQLDAKQELALSPIELAPGETKTLILKIPYLLVTEQTEQNALTRLDFDTERQAVAAYWHRRLEESAQLITPEPVLDQFYRAHAGHLLINCEREPNSTRRFARVGSFAYGAYGNESCMMVVDLDRRGYHREAQECLDAWLHYQGTVALPGDFSSKEGVLYGAGGYESGGYNQHHGWILWMLAEHFRFTRDEPWLRKSAPGILAGADWIIRETKRTANRHELERGLLPAGSLEDIGDWWTWLSTSCYTWRGLDSAAWALEQIQHPEAKRVRQEADAFHKSLLDNFHAASRRSPVVRLRDGTAVPKIPSYVHRRGRSFGWICETLEGAIHLLITGALDPRSPEAEWILKDYEDNLYLSNQYGYTLDDFDKWWFGRGGMSMQACLLLDVEPYLYRDDVKNALRAAFNGIAVSHFPDVHMNTEHALPEMGDWRGDHYKSSDEANATGWLRFLFVRESGDELLLGQAVPRDWLKPGQKCGIERTATWFGPASVLYTGANNEVIARVQGPTRNPPKQIRLRFRTPGQRPLKAVLVNGQPWTGIEADWVLLPGNIGSAAVTARY